jgi:uncharacterized protein (DUF4415 family)
MKMPDNIVSYTSEELAAMRARGESRTDWQRVKAMTDAEVEAAIAADPDAEEITDEDWKHVTMTIPVQLDAEMMTWLKSQGEDYQAHIQRLVREEMQQKHTGGSY